MLEQAYTLNRTTVKQGKVDTWKAGTWKTALMTNKPIQWRSFLCISSKNGESNWNTKKLIMNLQWLETFGLWNEDFHYCSIWSY